MPGWSQVLLVALGFAVSLGVGYIVVEWLVRFLQNLGDVNKRGDKTREPTEKERKFTRIFGLIERAAITAIGVFSLQAAGIFSLTWMGLKLACYWNRPGRVPAPKENETADESEEIFRRVARGGLTALIGSLMSALIGIAGALIARAQWCPPIG